MVDTPTIENRHTHLLSQAFRLRIETKFFDFSEILYSPSYSVWERSTNESGSLV